MFRTVLLAFPASVATYCRATATETRRISSIRRAAAHATKEETAERRFWRVSFETTLPFPVRQSS